MTGTTRTEHGVRHPDGHVEGPLRPDVGDYLDAPELAAVRAKASGGVVVTREHTVTTTPWRAAGETDDPRRRAAVLDFLERAHDNHPDGRGELADELLAALDGIPATAAPVEGSPA